MNKEIAALLKNKIRNLPFIDVLAGLVQTVEYVQFQDGDEKLVQSRKRFPVSYDVALGGDGCVGREKDLQPNSSKKSITYFEDYGSRVNATRDGVTDFTSQLRLVCWLNRNRLTGDAYSEITAFCIASIIPLICKANPENIEQFSQIRTKALTVPVQGPDLFAKYTYDETVRQFLRPPYEAFAIDFAVNYKIASNCLTTIDFNKEKVC